MTAQSKTVIKSYFETGDYPTQSQFGDLIDSYQDVNTLPTLYYTDTGSANVYVITSSAFTSLSSMIGIPIYVKIGNSNVGASTLNVNGYGATAINYINGNSLVNSALPAGAVAGFIYDGVEFQFINISPSTGGTFISALTGDVTASGSGSVAATIASNAVTTSKIADNNVTLVKLATQGADTVLANASSGSAVPTAIALTTSTLLGKGSSGNIAAITPNTGLAVSGTNLNVDVGTTANKIIQLDGSAKLPAVDGSQLLGLPGSYAFLGSATASTSATLDFTSLITSTYDFYVFEFEDIRPATSSTNFLIRTSSNNGSSYDSGASNYTYAGNLTIATPTNTAIGSTGATSLQIATSIANTAAGALSGTLKLYNPLGTVSNKNITSQISFIDGSGAGQASQTMSGQRASTSAVNAVRFLMTSGNITSGVIKMYGIKNS